MKRTVFVVEGQTEQIFLTKFISAMAALQPYRIHLFKYHNSEIIKLQAQGHPEEVTTHSIHIINVENDEKVLSYLEDNIETFIARGFAGVYGLRDKFTRDTKKTPVNPEAIDKRTQYLSQQHGVHIEVTVAVEEVEAWFLAVPAFFIKYHQNLTLETITSILGFDLGQVNVHELEHPSALINKILNSVGLAYRKKLSDSHKITEYLDYETLYLEKAQSISALSRTVDHLNSALA